MRRCINVRARLWVIVTLCLAHVRLAPADVLIGVNGERLVGTILKETPDAVVFQSEIVGRVSVSRSSIRELQRTTVTQTSPSSVTNVNQPAATTSRSWQPPGVGKDGFDWLQLKSDEWLKGHLNYVQDKKVQFESDKLEDLSLDFKDVRRIYSAKPMFIKFDNLEQVFGTVIVSNNVVEVIGPEQLQLPREQLTGITPGGSREINLWTGKALIGLSLQGGNTRQANLNASAEIARRTPATQFLMTYLGNYSEVEGAENANNHRVNLSYDVRLNKDWFIRPLQLEYYRDQLANISHKLTAGVGFGYYIFDRDKLEWKVAAGPGYVYTKFVSVQAGESDSASTPAGLLTTRFKADITSRLTFEQYFAATLASQQAGLYSHHWVSSLEFEIKRHLDLDISFVWDYLQNPQTEADQQVPLHSDFRLTLGVGVKF